MPYNRMVKDLNGNTEVEFLDKVGEKFHIQAMDTIEEPEKKYQITMILGDRVYRLTPKEGW